MKRIAALLVMILTLLATPGCVSLEYPIDLYLDEKFDEYETVMIVWAVDEWNRAITTRTGQSDPALRIVGTFSDEYDIEDSVDGIYAIYKVTEPTPAILRLARTSDDTVGGHATLADMLVLRYEFPKWPDKAWPLMLRAIVLHEFGHTLKITHFEHRYGIMNFRMKKESLQNPHITDADMDAYCHVHDCAQ